MLSPKELAAPLSVSTETVRRLCRNADLKGVHVGRQGRISEEDVQAYLNRDREEVVDAHGDSRVGDQDLESCTKHQS